AVAGGFTYTPTDAARHAAAADDATADQLTDTLQITVTDTDGNTTTVAVTVDIAPANVAPTATYTVDSFNNGDFELDFEGWTIIDSQVWLDGTQMIAGWPTPVDPTSAPDGGTETAPDRAIYQVYIEDGRVVLDSFLGGVPNTPEGSRIGGVVHGPALVSDAPVRINAGATIQFDWEASGGGDAYDVLGYVLDVDTGATSIILDATGATPGASQPVTQVNHTVTETGNFVFVFVAGSWDATAGHAAGARLSVDNIRVLNNSTSVAGEVAGLVSGHDADNDTLTYTAPTTTALGGTVVIDSATGEFTYTPTSEARHAAAGGGLQEDTFDVTVDDGHGGVITVAVTAPIDPANAAPEAAVTVGDPDTTTGAVTGTLAVTDPDGDGVAVTVPDPDARGAVVFDYTTGEFTFTPTAAARHDAAAEDATADELTDTFHFTVTDGHGGTLTVPITVDIAPANAGPAVGEVTAGVPDPDTGVVTVSVVASDPDSDSLTFSADALSALGGTITTDTSTTGGFVYTPTEAARQIATTDPTQRSDTFDVTVADGHGGSTTVSVTVDIAPLAPNEPPAITETVIGEPDPDTGVVSVSVVASDPDGDALFYDAGPTSAKGGTVTVDNSTVGGFIYTPTDAARHDAAADGATPDQLTDTITVTVSDAYGNTTTTLVTVDIEPATAAPQSATVTLGDPDPNTGEVSGAITAVDPDNDPLVFSAPATTTYGTVTIDPATGLFTYTPNQDARPTDPTFDATTITLTDPAAVTQGTFTTAASSLGNGSISQLGQSGSNPFNYVATFFTAADTQTYRLGQTSAPADTVMIVYDGAFAPSAPGTNVIGFNDDGYHPADLTPTGCGGRTSLCPSVSVDLTAGQTVSVVISTYRSGVPLGLPQSFYSTGPGAFSASPLQDTFVVTVSDGHGGIIEVPVTVDIAPLSDEAQV
ncbi:Ig-like domain-containing protein, partial [Micromonospora sp. WMMD737]|uniref:beta strand repeat-containing protein n=1 Tax=Micromonospora sp. WMMD737 TaxID=3404113 RepID=UPI003B9271E4